MSLMVFSSHLLSFIFCSVPISDCILYVYSPTYDLVSYQPFKKEFSILKLIVLHEAAKWEGNCHHVIIYCNNIPLKKFAILSMHMVSHHWWHCFLFKLNFKVKCTHISEHKKYTLCGLTLLLSHDDDDGNKSILLHNLVLWSLQRLSSTSAQLSAHLWGI